MGTNRAIVEAIFAEAQAELDAEHHQERQEGAKQAYFKDLAERDHMPEHRIHAQIISLAA